MMEWMQKVEILLDVDIFVSNDYVIIKVQIIKYRVRFYENLKNNEKDDI